jgi:hypothetical protein
MNGTDIEPLLGRDFAIRVLEAADRVVVRRRRVRRAAGTSAVCLGIAAIAVWLDFTSAPQGPALDRRLAFASSAPPPTDNVSAGSPAQRAGPPDALSWFFPDAEPLARYATAEDTGDDSANSAGALFADDE